MSETGWGEFEVQIKIHFNDVNERPVTFYHILKLFHNATGNEPGSIGPAPDFPEIISEVCAREKEMGAIAEWRVKTRMRGPI